MAMSEKIHELAKNTLEVCRHRQLKIATAESCTGGLISAALTEIAGSSDVFDRAYITYSNRAKFDMLGVPLEYTDGPPGAVSELVARKMVSGALKNSDADIAVAVTGIAGPGGGSEEKPVGLVYIAAGGRNIAIRVEEHRFGDAIRYEIRLNTVVKALQLLLKLVHNGN